MAYFRNDLISRPNGGVGAYADTVGDVRVRGAISRWNNSGMGDVGGTLKDIMGGALSFFGAQQRAAGATEALSQTNKDLLAAQQAQASSISPTTLVIGAGVVGIAAFLLLRKKKAA